MQRVIILVIALIGLGIIFSVTNTDFLTKLNLLNIITQSTPILLIAFGMTIIIISGNIDLSVGSVASFVGVIAVKLMLELNIPFIIAMLIGVSSGALIGIFNGFVISFLGVPAFIATLAMMSLARGAAFILSGGYAMRSRNEGLSFLYNENLIGIRFPIIMMIVLLLLIVFLLSQTKLGRAFYAMGGNPKASMLCGLNNKRLTLIAFALGGLLTGLSGLLTSSRMAAGSPTIGMGWELQAIAIVIFGGANLFGGEGSIFGTLLAGLIIGMINNWMSLTGLDWWLQGFVEGSLLILVVGINQYTLNKRASDSKKKQTLKNIISDKQHGA